MLIYPDTFTDDARTIMFHARAHARLSATGTWAASTSCSPLPLPTCRSPRSCASTRVTPERVEEENVRPEGLGPAAACSPASTPAHWQPSASIPAPVRDRIEASFGPDALARASQATQRNHPTSLRAA